MRVVVMDAYSMSLVFTILGVFGATYGFSCTGGGDATDVPLTGGDNSQGSR